jgi:hypothetical protein
MKIFNPEGGGCVKRIRFLCLVILLALFTGCSSLNAEELYCLPEATDDYYDLQEALSKVLSSGLSYQAPTSGARREPVQLVDLTGDGVDEAVAFFRSDEDGIQAYIFSRQDSTYEPAAVIGCAGSSVGSVEYADLDGDGSLELFLASEVSEDVTQALQVLRFDGQEATPLLTTSCAQYLLESLSSDSSQSVLCFGANGAEAATVDCFRLEGSQMISCGQVRLGSSYDSLLSIQSGTLSDGVPALLVTAAQGEDQLLTDILTLDGNALTQLSFRTTEYVQGQALYPQDLDQDGQTEFPEALLLKPYDSDTAAQSLVAWYSISSQDKAQKELLTYQASGWYLELPDSWEDQVTVREESVATATCTVNSVSFYHLTKSGRPGDELLTVYTLRGESRQDYAEEQGLTILRSDTEVIFAVRLNEDAEPWEGSLSMSQISEQFHSTQAPEESQNQEA